MSLIPSSLDATRWRLKTDDGRQTWHFVKDNESAEKQSSIDKYWLGILEVGVFGGACSFISWLLCSQANRLPRTLCPKLHTPDYMSFNRLLNHNETLNKPTKLIDKQRTRRLSQKLPRPSNQQETDFDLRRNCNALMVIGQANTVDQCSLSQALL